VVGAAFVAEASGFNRAITLDIGGTSTDVALIDGAITEATDGKIGGYPTKLPMIDIHTVGAGGGSIAWFDVGGALRVGPKSAGADPGPAAYGRGGTEPTVTDANVVLGRLIPTAFLGGTMSLDTDQARKAVGSIAGRLGTSPEEAAWGIIRIVNANMEAAIRVISVERGSDPRQFILAAFGGAGPLHACELAMALQIPRVFIPKAPGVLSALGMLAADIIKDYVRTIMVHSQEAHETVEKALSELEEQGRAELAQEGFSSEQVTLEPALDLRYVGQSYELSLPFEGNIERAVTHFHAAHIPVHLGSMPDSVASALDTFDHFSPGDIIALNDPFLGGTHLPDITLIAPIYVQVDGQQRLIGTRWPLRRSYAHEQYTQHSCRSL
jgi:N-methylhydantoinase A